MINQIATRAGQRISGPKISATRVAFCGVTSSFGYAIGQRHRHGNGIQTEREKLTKCDRQVITHLEQAQNLEGTLTEYGAAYGLDVKDLTSG
jgi:hypothetical protein